MLVVDGSSLRALDVARVSTRRDEVALHPAARAAAARAHAESAATVRPVYGRSTGVGGNRLVPLESPPALVNGALPDDAVDPALALLRSHATSSGRLRSLERIRATLLVRLNQLAAGGSGADPVVLDSLLDMLTLDALPPIRELGGVGTGDLGALATTALTMLGEIRTTPPLPRPIRLGIGDALPLLSSNAATIADAALATVRLRGLARTALLIAAATFVGVDGNAEAFAEVVEGVTPFPGAQDVCRTMRRLTADSPPAARIQDAFALRAMPQVHGPLLDALDTLDTTVTRLMNSTSENPVYRPGAEVTHHGGFHVAYLAQALDGVCLALAQAAQLSLARVNMLCDPRATSLPAFLGDGRPGASGVMLIEYVSASALAQLRTLATPAALQTVSLSHGLEEDASFASLAARQAIDAVDAYRSMLAGELLAAVRCLRAKGRRPAALLPLLDAAEALHRSEVDRDLTADLLLAERVLDQTGASELAGIS